MSFGSVTQTVILTAVATITTIAGTFLYKKWKEVKKVPTEWERVGNVTKIHIYPLKSGHRIELHKTEITEVGLRQLPDDQKRFQLRDRVLVVYGTNDNKFRTARTFPKMVLITVAAHDENHLAINAPTMSTLYVKIPKRGDNKTVNVGWWENEEIQAIDCGDEAAVWFSRYITEKNSGLRLGYNDVKYRRDITKVRQKFLDYYKNLSNKSTGLFSDITSVTLMNQQSVNDLNKRVENSSVTPEHFRLNIVVDGVDLQAYDEDNWDYVKVGDEVILQNVMDVTRCSFTTIDPEQGVRNPKREPLKTLEMYRQHSGPSSAPRFGISLEVTKTGIINVGDSVYVSRVEKKS